MTAYGRPYTRDRLGDVRSAGREVRIARGGRLNSFFSVVGVVWVLSITGGCAAESRSLRRSSRDLGDRLVAMDVTGVEALVLPAYRTHLDHKILFADSDGRGWAQRLRQPIDLRLTARVIVGDAVVDTVSTLGSWCFTVDPTVFYGQSTPRSALGSFVLATTTGRWDVLLRLAPRRYRIGLSTHDLEQAWTRGASAKDLHERRDRLAENLVGTILVDSHQATLILGDGGVVRLEREGERWVIVDF